MNLKDYIKDVPNYPKEGILFKDITPLLLDKDAFNFVVDEIASFANSVGANVVLGPESRGFIFGCPVAYKNKIGFVPVRKPGKLPRKTIEESYDLEYGSNTLCMHKDAINPGDKVVIIDDLLATGGTVAATVDLVKQLGGEVVGACFLIELVDLNGRKLLEGLDVHTLLKY